MTLSTPRTHWLRAFQTRFTVSLVNTAHFGAYLEPLIQAMSPGWTTLGHRAQIVAIRHESASVITLVLRPRDRWSGFLAGQFVELSVELNGRKLTRCFSVSSSPSHFKNTGTIELTIRVKPEGRVGQHLQNNARVGENLQISHATGAFTLKHIETPLLFIAGGSGITPFRSMMQELAMSGSKRQVTLLYYASHPSAHIFQQELEQMVAKNLKGNVHCITTQSQGRFTASHLEQHCPDFANRDIYLCGPTGLIHEAQKTLEHLAVPAENIHLEYFGPTPIQDSEEADAGRVILKHSSRILETTPSEPKTILNLAEEAGMQPSFGCRMGICGQCQCQKTSGVVRNTRTGALSDNGSEAIRICVSVPVGDVNIEI